ncbi:Calx-beta domain-containing protein [Rubrivirga sp. IMCC43871]|uniref:Calx-beta domain-containing protein n=1 Tax=Rubrivirga sp. IMCC43871 TaxID=3391575 RepID=UPI00399008DA
MTRLNLLALLTLALASPLSAQTVLGTIDLPADAGPDPVAIDETTNTIYVGNFDGTVSVIDGATNGLETIAVGTVGLHGAGVNATTNTLYVTESSAGNVVVIDGSDRTIVTRILVGGGPLGVAVNETTNTIYVANQTAGAVTFIDGSDNSATLPTTGLGSQQPLSLAVNETTNRLYVAERDGELTVVDATTGAVLANPVVGANPQRVAVDETTNRVYVSDRGNDVVVVVDGATNLVLATIPVGVGPQGIAVDAGRGLVYVANEDDATVSVIDAVTDQVLATLDVGTGPFTVAPFGVGVNAATNRVYVANFSGDSVSIIGPFQATVTGVDLLVDTTADDQPYDATTSMAACTDGELDGDCTLREAIQVANANDGQEVPNLDTIGFEVLDAFGAVGGTATIAPTSALPGITDDGVDIDGYTQPGSSPNTLAVGSNAVIRVQLDGSGAGEAGSFDSPIGLSVQSVADVTIRGLAVYSFNGSGIRLQNASGAVIEGNHIGTDAAGTQRLGNVFGITIADSPNTLVGTNGDGQNDQGERNVLSGNRGSGVSPVGTGSTGSVIAGNYIGTDASGTAALGNNNFGVFTLFTAGILVGTDGDGQNDAAERNVISGNLSNGVRLQDAADITIAGNYIGTDATGTVELGNQSDGIFAFANSSNLRVGTDGNDTGDADERNVISGNEGSGVTIGGTPTAPSPNAIVAGNYIGVGADGTSALGNRDEGVLISGAQNARVGTRGSAIDAESNLIAFNAGQGVLVGVSGGQDGDASILGNRIFSNGGLGIDLEGGTEDGSGVTENDADDSDSGPNDLQNYPVITAATPTETGGAVDVSLTSAQGSYLIEIFASDAADASGFGEGARFVGARLLTVAADGGTAVGSIATEGLDPGDIVTATATPTSGSDFGGTSEFSRAVRVAPTVQFATPASASAEEGDTVDLTVTLSTPAPTGGVTVEIVLVEDEDDATTPGDLGGFTAQTETVTFAAGETSQTVPLTITEDGAAEGVESFLFDLENATGAFVAQPSRFDLEVAASEQTVTVAFATTEYSAREGQTTTLTATLTTGDGAPLGENASFTFTQVDGSADNDDFAPSTAGTAPFDGDFPETLTALAGTPSGTDFQVAVALEDDGVVEGDEIATLEVTSPDATIIDGDITLTIEDAPAIQFAAEAYVAEEGDTVELRVTLSEAAAGTEAVDVVFADGDPTSADSDDLDGFTSTTIDFDEGDLEAVVTIAVPRDGRTEGDEAFTFELQNLVGLGLGTPSETVLTVALSIATVALEISAYNAEEGDAVEVEVTLSDAAVGGEAVEIALTDTSGPGATSEDLGGFTSATVTFADGAMSATVVVPITRDGIAEGTETFTLSLGDADGLDVSVEDETTITVAPSKAAVQFADAAFMVAEGATATLTLTLGSPAGGGETVEVVLVATSPDGADADDVGGFETQTVTFATGDLTAAIAIAITDDGRTEGAEAFTFEIQNATGLEVGTPAQTVVTVDPSATSISFSAGDLTATEGVDTVELDVEFGEALAEGGSFDIVLAGSAPDGAGPDDLDGFEAVTVEVQAGATSVTVEIPVTDDALAEGPETFEFEIQNATGGDGEGLALDRARLTLTITDNDNPVANEADVEESSVGLAYPNPTTGSAWLEVAVDVPQRVRVEVLDAVGRVVGVPFEGRVSGVERIEVGGRLAPGTYVVRIVGETVSGTRKLTVAR